MGFAYQATGRLIDARSAPPPSEMVQIGDARIHIFCRGQGTRTYLLDAGAGVGTFEWDRLAPLLGKSARVCAFDRPGLGWSDDMGDAHDIASQADRISTIVTAARIPKPFVYVGHSLGANIAMVYRERHPGDVAAVVLIEPGVPRDMLEDFHGTRAEAMQVTDCGLACHAAEVATWFGVTRLGARLAGAGSKTLDEGMRRQYLIGLGRPAQIRTTVATLDTLPKSAYQLDAIRTFGDTPVLVLSSSEPRKRDSDESPGQYNFWRILELAYFKHLAGMSTHGAGPVIIPNSNHATMVMGEPQAARVARIIEDFAKDS
jgi:pimeloyl-ACP methyl ester carboxylesterase